MFMQLQKVVPRAVICSVHPKVSGIRKVSIVLGRKAAAYCSYFGGCM